jgi:hypothetical protein
MMLSDNQIIGITILIVCLVIIVNELGFDDQRKDEDYEVRKAEAERRIETGEDVHTAVGEMMTGWSKRKDDK